MHFGAKCSCLLHQYLSLNLDFLFCFAETHWITSSCSWNFQKTVLSSIKSPTSTSQAFDECLFFKVALSPHLYSFFPWEFYTIYLVIPQPFSQLLPDQAPFPYTPNFVSPFIKIHKVQFLPPIYSWIYDLLVNMISLPVATPLKKIDFSPGTIKMLVWVDYKVMWKNSQFFKECFFSGHFRQFSLSLIFIVVLLIFKTSIVCHDSFGLLPECFSLSFNIWQKHK